MKKTQLTQYQGHLKQLIMISIRNFLHTWSGKITNDEIRAVLLRVAEQYRDRVF